MIFVTLREHTSPLLQDVQGAFKCVCLFLSKAWRNLGSVGKWGFINSSLKINNN